MKSFTGCKKLLHFLLTLIFCYALCGVLLTGFQKLIYVREYKVLIERCSKEYGVPSEIVYAVVFTESRFDPEALSRAGAIGLMQLMPQTFESVSDELGISGEDPYQPEVNIRCGAYLLSILYEKYGSWETVYAAYNAGERAVNLWLLDNRYSKNGKLTNIPYPETAAYVVKVKNAAMAYKRLYSR